MAASDLDRNRSIDEPPIGPFPRNGEGDWASTPLG